MNEIYPNVTKQHLYVQIQSMSMHAVAFIITIFDEDKNTEIARIEGTTQKDDTFKVQLPNTATFYKGKYIRGLFIIKSIDGKDDAAYKLRFSILEDDDLLTPDYELSDTTTDGNARVVKAFHLN